MCQSQYLTIPWYQNSETLQDGICYKKKIPEDPPKPVSRHFKNQSLPPRCLLHRKRQQRDRARALDGFRELALVLGAVAGHAAGHYFAALIGEPADTADVFIVDELDLIHTKAAHFAARPTASARAPCAAIATIFGHMIPPKT